MGSGSVAAAARVEPSPQGLAQADTAARVDSWIRIRLCDGYLHRALSTHPTLFGEMSLIRNWGRIGTNGQTMMQTFDGSAEAIEAFRRLERTKRRRGYAVESCHSLGTFRGLRLRL